MYMCFFCFCHKTAYEMRISDWSSDVCSSDRQHVVGKQIGVDRRTRQPLRPVAEHVRQRGIEAGLEPRCDRIEIVAAAPHQPGPFVVAATVVAFEREIVQRAVPFAQPRPRRTPLPVRWMLLPSPSSSPLVSLVFFIFFIFLFFLFP